LWRRTAVGTINVELESRTRLNMLTYLAGWEVIETDGDSEVSQGIWSALDKPKADADAEGIRLQGGNAIVRAVRRPAFHPLTIDYRS
jgi:hypothetical protein